MKKAPGGIIIIVQLVQLSPNTGYPNIVPNPKSSLKKATSSNTKVYPAPEAKPSKKKMVMENCFGQKLRIAPLLYSW